MCVCVRVSLKRILLLFIVPFKSCWCPYSCMNPTPYWNIHQGWDAQGQASALILVVPISRFLCKNPSVLLACCQCVCSFLRLSGSWPPGTWCYWPFPAGVCGLMYVWGMILFLVTGSALRLSGWKDISHSCSELKFWVHCSIFCMTFCHWLSTVLDKHAAAPVHILYWMLAGKNGRIAQSEAFGLLRFQCGIASCILHMF